MKHHKLLPKVTDNLMTWDDIIEVLGFYCQHGLLNQANTGDKPDPNRWDYFYTLMLIDLQMPDRMPHKVAHVHDTLGLTEEKQKKINQGYIPNVSIYMSLAPNAFSHGIHCDVTDVYHWQQVGTTRWTVYDNGKHTYELNPGDVLYVPRGMYHDTLPLTPRAGLSVGWFPRDFDVESPDPVKDYFKSKHIPWTDKPDDKSMQSIFNLK
jgi:hypothetical protein